MARGEFELIADLRERLAAAGAPTSNQWLRVGSGDDAAVSEPGGATATSVDALVDGVHFRMPPFEPRSVGHKALAVALSDLAAMGAQPGEAYVQLGIPEGLGDQALLELADGLAAVAGSHSTVVAGGDVTRSPVLFCAVTVVGHARRADELVTRAGAAAGDLVAVTGELGGAAAGLMLLERPELADSVEPQVAAALRARQLEPTARVEAGLALAESASAMIDISDGLGGDAGHVARAGGVAVELEVDSLPLVAGVDAVADAAGRDPLELALSGGEDYELLVTLPAARLEGATRACAQAGSRLTAIGRVCDGEGVKLSGSGASALPTAGFDQRRSQ